MKTYEIELQSAQTQAEEYRQAGLRGLDRETAQQQRIAALEGEIAARSRDIIATENLLSNAEQDHDQLRAECERYNQQLADKSIYASQLEQERAQLRDEVAELKKANAETWAGSPAVKAELDQLRADNAKLRLALSASSPYWVATPVEEFCSAALAQKEAP